MSIALDARAAATDLAGLRAAWAGAVRTDPGRGPDDGLPQGCLSWGGIYGHNWIVDPARGRTLVALANTAVEGMNGAFAVEVALASLR